jgi:hypothetical protein
LYAISNGEEMLMTADHILPKSKGGTNDPENLQLLCDKCNRFKSDKILSCVFTSLPDSNTVFLAFDRQVHAYDYLEKKLLFKLAVANVKEMQLCD